MKPALTGEEWATPFVDFCHNRIGYASNVCGEDGEPIEYLTVDGETCPEDRVALAARWLHEAGWFTHEDVRMHRRAAESFRMTLANLARESQQRAPDSGQGLLAMFRGDQELLARAHWHESMAERIAALLPPEETP